MMDKSRMLQKTAVAFAKTGPAIYHSHHDMMRFWERAIKRADLPIRMTQGFNPRPRLVFPHALGLGIASGHEEVELEFFAPMEKDELLRRIDEAAGDTVEILGAVDLPPVKNSRQLVSSSYLIAGWGGEAFAGLVQACEAILAKREITVERGAPGKRRSVDIRQYIMELSVSSAPEALFVRLAHSVSGAGRPDEISRLAAEVVGADPFDLTIEKVAMELV